MKNFHIKARQHWEAFLHDGKEYCLKHLSCHEVIFEGRKDTFKFIVSYGLHCFAKSEQEHSINVNYADDFETRQINLERYHLSKYVRGIVEELNQHKLLFETTREKYFTFEHINDLTGESEKCKICLCVFKENRLLRIHVTSAFFVREKVNIPSNGLSIFKIALDAKKKPKRHDIPKEATRG